MNHKKYLAVLLALLIVPSLACGLIDTAINKATGSSNDNYQPVSTLWPDVPAMDGLTPSPVEEMPAFVKLTIRVVLGNMGNFSTDKPDPSAGVINWIVFSTSKTPQDVQNFYTNDLMTANGWDKSSDTPCLNGSQQGAAEAGVICAFTKTQDGKAIQLGIITIQDATTKLTNVFYLRLEGTATTSAPTAAP